MDTPIPYVLQVPSTYGGLVDWAQHERDRIERALLTHGALLFRSARINGRSDFAEFVTTFTEPAEYVYRSTPRTSYGDRLYSATDYPAQYEIPLHCENSYQDEWPRLLFFFCEQPARQGGQTPIADIERVTDRIPAKVIELFEQRSIRYTRNYYANIDVDWRTVFQAESRSVVEQYCRAHDIEYMWLEDDVLRTHQVRPAMALHPQRQILLWFNQVHLFHVSAYPADLRESLLSLYGWEGLPRNAYFADGSRIPDDIVDQIRDAYDSCVAEFSWRENDVLMVDNMAVAHGRRSFQGDRRILVMMGNGRR